MTRDAVRRTIGHQPVISSLRPTPHPGLHPAARIDCQAGPDSERCSRVGSGAFCKLHAPKSGRRDAATAQRDPRRAAFADMSAPPHKKAKLGLASTLDPSAAHPPTFHTPSSHPSTSAARPENHGPARTKRKVPTHGNFYGYFTKRSRVAGGDERLGLVPREWVAGKRALDVGCNSGVVTVELAQGFGASEAVGVDIDDGLVELAKKYSKLVGTAR